MISSYPYISSYTFRSTCQHGMMMPDDTHHVKSLGNVINPSTIKDGDTIYLVTELVPNFFKHIDPNIKSKYHLICGRSDILITNEFSKYLNDKILSWSSPNMVADCDDRFISIPLGLQNLNWGYDGNPQSDINLLDNISKEDISISGDILMTFQIHTNRGERQKCYDYFKDMNCVSVRNYNNDDRKDKNFVSDYFREIRKHKFVVCPWGNGVDCHRNWEVWYLGGIPIIKRHKALEGFYDLPAWWVDEWEEVTEDKIYSKYEEIKSKNWNLDKLNFDFWNKNSNKIC